MVLPTARPERPSAPRPNSISGSVSKQFTAAGILVLADRGTVGLDAPLERYIPGIPNGSRITVRQLLTHTACGARTRSPRQACLLYEPAFNGGAARGGPDHDARWRARRAVQLFQPRLSPPCGHHRESIRAIVWRLSRRSAVQTSGHDTYRRGFDGAFALRACLWISNRPRRDRLQRPLRRHVEREWLRLAVLHGR